MNKRKATKLQHLISRYVFTALDIKYILGHRDYHVGFSKFNDAKARKP